MRTILKISTVLSWFNLVVWGFVVLTGIYSALASQNMAFLVIAFLLSAILLHNYAALQLHKSIKNPSKPLSSQTPAGIRFIGAIALFLGVICFIYGMALVQNPREILRLVQPQFPQAKDFSINTIRSEGVFMLTSGVCITLNVIFNFRLLRWYHFMKGMM
jgi:hypothetical protein